MRGRVDCIINVFGKPCQTALTLFSLLKHSGRHIDKIYFIEEKGDTNKGEGATQVGDMDFIVRMGNNDALLGKLVEMGKLEYFNPPHWLWMEPVKREWLADESYRLSQRYQYGWERSDKDFVFITHNDCIYRGDIVGALLGGIGDNIAAGHVGQCWNCPASWSGKCNSDKYWDYRPPLEELKRLYHNIEPPAGLRKRPYHLPEFHEQFQKNPWPLPECRVNEWCALINLKEARGITSPLGPAVPFGAHEVGTYDKAKGGVWILDTAVQWFRDMSLMGRRCRNFPIYDYMEHVTGSSSMRTVDRYMANETKALEILEKEFM